MDTRVQLDRIDQALLQAHQERTQYHQASMAAPRLRRADVVRLRRADVVLSTLTAGAVFGWSFGAVTLALRLAGHG